MNGPDHYNLAEEYLRDAETSRASADDDEARELRSFAQVHALLALTAATAANIRRNGALPVDAHVWAPITAVAQESS